MKSPLYEQQESASSIVQRVINKKKFTQDILGTGNKTAQERRLNDFYDSQSERRVQSSVQKGKKSRKKKN